MADPIVPNTPNVDGQVITIAMTFISGGATREDDVTDGVASTSLPTYVPLIDTRIGHPVLSGCLISTQTDSTGSLNLKPQNEMGRATAADTNGEWRVKNSNTVSIYHTADQDGIVILSYIAFGSQQA